ncbi:hypothetical protein ACWDAZ_05520, partial [Streptomyces sp. NPDC001215]
PAPSHIDGITGFTKSVAGVELHDGRSVGLAGGTDGVWVWDLNDEHPAPSHIEGITGFVQSVAGVELRDGRSLGLAGGTNGAWVWNLNEENPTPSQLKSKTIETGVWSVRWVTLGGRTFGLVGGSLWDLSQETPVVTELRKGLSGSLAEVAYDGRVLVFTHGRWEDFVVRDLDDDRIVSVVHPLKSTRGNVVIYSHFLNAVVLSDGRLAIFMAIGDAGIACLIGIDHAPNN